MDAMPAHSFCPSLATLATFPSISSLASLHASPKPTIAGTFSVPARKPISWKPPCKNGSHGYAVSEIQAGSPFRAIKLVAGNRHSVHTELLHVDGDLAAGTGAVRVEEHALLFEKSADLLDRLDRSYLHVRVHDGDEDRTRRHLFLQVRHIDETVGVDLYKIDLKAKAAQKNPPEA